MRDGLIAPLDRSLRNIVRRLRFHCCRDEGGDRGISWKN